MLSRIAYFYSRFGIPGVMGAVRSKLGDSSVLLEIEQDGIKNPFYLRLGTTDVLTFDQIFIEREYDFETSSPPQVIVDAGANIGLASIYFANRFVEAKIIAIEPEGSNFKALQRNVAPYPNIVPLQAALWGKNEEIDLVDPGLGEWGFMAEEGRKDGDARRGKLRSQVQGKTVDRIMQEHDLPKIDILKIDIEGAEREVFSNTSSWIGKVDAIIIELHERMKPGCHRSFYNGSNGFDDEWRQGENVYLSKGKLLAKRQVSDAPLRNRARAALARRGA